jgi:hypothetical protein
MQCDAFFVEITLRSDILFVRLQENKIKRATLIDETLDLHLKWLEGELLKN